MRATLRLSYMSLANQGESAAGVAAVEVFFDHLFDDRTEEAVFSLKTLLIFRDEPLERTSIFLATTAGFSARISSLLFRPASTTSGWSSGIE